MATLLYNAIQYTLGEASEDIGEIVQGIAAGLPTLGYTGVQVADVQAASAVHGHKGSFVLGITYLLIGDRNFWQVIACGGEGHVADADAQLAEVANLIKNLAFALTSDRQSGAVPK